MSTEILMPALSPTMTEGTLARWLKREGDAIVPGDVLAEIETDKATMEVEAVDEGTLARILVGDGTTNVAVNTPIAILSAQGETLSTPPPPPPPPPPAAIQTPADRTRVFASPLARRIARNAGVALDGITGTGPNGRIVAKDVDAATSKHPMPRSEPPAPTALATVPQNATIASTAASYRTVPNSGMRRAIAKRLTESLATRPHFYVTMDIEIDALLELRAKLNKKSMPAGTEGAFRLSVNDMLIKAAAIAHRRVPGVAVTYTDEAILHYDDIDISIAVAIPDGLIAPIVRNADRKGLAAISNEARDLVARARTGTLRPDEFQGGAFSISNLGMFGVRGFTAIINPPQSAILALGAGEKRPVVHAGALAVATVMTATLSSDHRAVDGALAARWLAAFKGIVQDPLELML